MMTNKYMSAARYRVKSGANVTYDQWLLLHEWGQARDYRNRLRRRLKQGLCIKTTPMFWERVMKECEDELVKEGLEYQLNKGWWFVGGSRG